MAGCKKIGVETYSPDEAKHSSVPTATQAQRVRDATGQRDWRAMPPPSRGLDKVHKRLLRAIREDGTAFEVLFDRGSDFIVERHRVGPTTRETFIIVRDPA